MLISVGDVIDDPGVVGGGKVSDFDARGVAGMIDHLADKSGVRALRCIHCVGIGVRGRRVRHARDAAEIDAPDIVGVVGKRGYRRIQRGGRNTWRIPAVHRIGGGFFEQQERRFSGAVRLCSIRVAGVVPTDRCRAALGIFQPRVQPVHAERVEHRHREKLFLSGDKKPAIAVNRDARLNHGLAAFQIQIETADDSPGMLREVVQTRQREVIRLLVGKILRAQKLSIEVADSRKVGDVHGILRVESCSWFRAASRCVRRIDRP